MNAIAMILLMVGILSLGKYQESLIEAKLQTFYIEMQLVAESVGEIALHGRKLHKERTEGIVRRFLETNIPQRIRIFDHTGQLMLDSATLSEVEVFDVSEMHEDEPYVEVLKDMASFALSFLPDRKTLPPYPRIETTRAEDLPGVSDAIEGLYSLSAWSDEDQHVYLSGAWPLQKNGVFAGAVLLSRSAKDIDDEIGDMWLNIVFAFIVTLVMTVLISSYLSRFISSPLRKLARAADNVRKGQESIENIPNFSSRGDEIGDLSVALREMMNALWDRMDLIEHFAADVAHELKNPLTSLRSAIETLSIVKDKEDRDKLVDVIKHDLDRLDRLITDISHASRLDSELSRDIYEPINLDRILAGLLDSYTEPLLRDEDGTQAVTLNGVEIALKTGDMGETFVWALEGRLEQVFQNLLANALSFSEANDHILISIQDDDGFVKVTFEDEGPGIPEKNLEAIFDRFYTERPTHESYGQHSGLGLSICKQIITAMGGKIYAENITDEKGAVSGARFTVLLKKT